jgi:hypothetical protein
MKYSSEQLQSMAETCLHAKSISDPRYHVLVAMLAHQQRMSPIEVETRIFMMAKDGCRNP